MAETAEVAIAKAKAELAQYTSGLIPQQNYMRELSMNLQHMTPSDSDVVINWDAVHHRP